MSFRSLFRFLSISLILSAHSFLVLAEMKCVCFHQCVRVVAALHILSFVLPIIHAQHSRDCNDIHPAAMRIGVVMYADQNISQYAHTAYEINAAYARTHGYDIILFNEKTSNYETRDQRWNKVKIIGNAIDVETGVYRTHDYVVWLDSDLIVIDFNLTLEDIIRQFPTSDIILSSEAHAETGVGNTGSFIVRNCAWSRSFIKDWWENFDRSLAHDQIFFDRLYKSRLPGIRDHVALLPPDTLNSIPPAMLFQSQESKVLHLMGEHPDLRERIFEMGLRHIEHATAYHLPLKHQLGLTQSVLFNEARMFFMHILESNLNYIKTAQKLDVEAFFRNVSEAREAMIQLELYVKDSWSKFPTDSRVAQDDAVLRKFRSEMFEEVKQVAEQLTESGSANKHNLVQSWHLCALHGNDMLPYTESIEEKRGLLHMITRYLALLASNVHSSSLPFVLELQQRHLTSIGQFEFENGNYVVAANALLDSMEIGKRLGSSENLLYRVDALMLLGSIHCFRGDVELVDGLTYLKTAIDLQKSLLYAEEQLKSDHLKLAESLLRAASCAAKQHLLTDASQFVEEAQYILSRHHDKVASERLANVAQQLSSSILNDSKRVRNNDIDIHLGEAGKRFARKKMRKRVV